MSGLDSRELISQALGLHQQGQLERAAAIYAQLLQQEPENFAALQLLGVLRSQQGRHVEAKKLLEAALQLQPRDFGVLLNYGQVLMGTGACRDALNAFDK